MKLSTIIDDFIGLFAPSRAQARIESRMRIQVLRNHQTMNDLLGTGTNGYGYDAGKVNRLTKSFPGRRASENAIPREQLGNLRGRSWDLFRNNPHARKICRQLKSKVIGRGIIPQSQATLPDGKPFKDYRRRAKKVWSTWGKECDYRGKPGFGGQPLLLLQKLALQHCVLSGSAFASIRKLTKVEQRRMGLFLPLQLQLIHRERLDETKLDDETFHGFGIDDSQRTKYWFYDRHPTDHRGPGESKEVDAKSIVHLYVEEDVDQIDGVPWFSAALLQMRNTSDYEYNELMASAAAACVVGVYKQSAGQTGGFGLPYPNDTTDLTDADGNAITQLSPMMFINAGPDGSVELLNPSRPSNNAGDWINHMVRSEASSVPGIKGSSLTQDYRNSSFSSERSADNDNWPELEELQDWFACNFCQPIYEAVIEAAVLDGKFDDIQGFSVTDFTERKREYLETRWQGPVARSINPVDDAKAGQERIRGGVSSPQREAALIGADTLEILQEMADFMAEARDQGIPEDIVMQILGIQQQDSVDGGTNDQAKTETDQDETDNGQGTEGRAAADYAFDITAPYASFAL